MSATLVASELSVVRGGQVVLDGVSLTVAPGDRIGVVGPNGVGKSTLLRALAGQAALDAGRVELSPPSANVGLLPQEPDRRPGETLRAFLERRTGVAVAQAALDEATEALTAGRAGADDAYASALERWLAIGGADLDVRAEQVCAELGLPPGALDEPTTALSGGQAARGSLAAVLLSRFDITLLDEPTNDLDFDGLERLERFVAGISGALVVVSHDREFLDRTITSVAEIDQHRRDVTEYAGGWSAYLEGRDLARRHARERYEEFADTRADLVAQVQRQREQSVRGAIRAKRKVPDNDRSVRSYKIEAATKSASRVRNLETKLGRLEEVEEPRKEWQLRMTIAAAPRSGDVVATLAGAVVAYPSSVLLPDGGPAGGDAPGAGGFRLGPVDLTVSWADRIVITGPNGGGKSTLLAALLGRVPLAAGAATLGSGVRLGEVDQARERFRGEETTLAVAERVTGWAMAEVRTLFAKFGLGADQMTRAAGALSPGERTRAGLALLQAVGVNCLVLDEPTNHLDLPAIEQLEAALDGYPGTLLLVTHDRRMLDAVHVTRRLHVEDGQVTESAV
ncbi:ABC-F family ATP-binding cassette domain-containing protein [Frankia nepalensis]|uniref:ABC-F family ATP-binding cassette domain-containing protein n=1 Tax=Frankia nepalensis TaxID=1836974 RepID=A0A937UQD0_9ACTN|nr:ABC-F family ATP-binding cassette domain-containing protein [Frankia nepalensis]MBL7495904.1 ABC-F family ATP-binding cassette domain-containing protein [Frankia nepalensis]MBL7510369.1 ABC-F family ATP-binding cassette domain-containing protein [Frankia nepalensis]MBL7629968.1 ABC-F family ATP-binding cassette domain-containing protein [Frankia nepalensis]